jgi:glycerol kinase
MGFVLGIDLGTTATKSIIFDRDSNIMGSGYRELPQLFPKPGWVEHDPVAMWRTVTDSVAEALLVSGIDKKGIEAVGVAHQGESVMSWDAVTGEPFYNNIVWQDRRGASRCDELKRREGVDQWVNRKTGLLVDPFFSSTKIEWLLKNIPAIRHKLLQDRVRAGTLDAWMISKLSGGRSFYTDYTSASRTMLFNLREMTWDEELLQEFSIPRGVLAEPKPSSFHFGVTDPTVFLGIEAPIGGAVVDQQGAMVGQTCFDQGDIKNTYGTSCVVQLNIGDDLVFSDKGVTTTVAFGLPSGAKFAVEGIVYITGAAIQWLRDGLQIISDGGETEAMARSVDSTLGVYFVPAFVGLAAPFWDYRTRGTIVGLTRGVRKEHIVRATLEAITYHVKDVVDLMEAETGVQASQLRVDGGAVRNGFLMQFQSDILGIPVIVPRVTETTCLGAAYLAGLAVGFWKNLHELKENWRVDRTYEPTMVRSKAEELYGGWKKVIKKVIDIYR